MIRASVVIPSWNGAHHLETCLPSLQRQTERDFEIVVVDGGSTDATRALLRERFPEAAERAVWLPFNRGFAAAANAGIRMARGEIIVLLNNDTEAEPTWLAELVAAIEADERIGLATSKVKLFDRRDHLHTTGDVVYADGDAANRGAWEVDTGQYDEETEVFGASGAAMALRRALVDDVGLFEEAFESYMEDVDLAWRARLRGWRCVYAPRAVVYHRVSATGGGAYASYRVARNRLWVIARNMPLGLLRRHALEISRAQCAHTAAAARSWRGREARATLRGLLVGLLTLPACLPARRAIQARRTESDEALDALLEPASRTG